MLNRHQGQSLADTVLTQQKGEANVFRESMGKYLKNLNSYDIVVNENRSKIHTIVSNIGFSNFYCLLHGQQMFSIKD